MPCTPAAPGPVGGRRRRASAAERRGEGGGRTLGGGGPLDSRLAPALGHATLENAGIVSAIYAVRIERITADGIEARFVRATYRCGNGATVEQAWGSDPSEPPVPACPATDDRSATLGPGDAGAGSPREIDRAPPDPIGVRFPYGRSGLFWFGAALASASLLGAGLLLRGGAGRDARGPGSGA